MPTNLQRAFWAETALFAYSDEKTTVPLPPMALYDDKQDVLTDLLCDLMHYAGIDDALDFQAALERAAETRAAELAEETT